MLVLLVEDCCPCLLYISSSFKARARRQDSIWVSSQTPPVFFYFANFVFIASVGDQSDVVDHLFIERHRLFQAGKSVIPVLELLMPWAESQLARF